jgi:hypothetical protein
MPSVHFQPKKSKSLRVAQSTCRVRQGTGAGRSLESTRERGQGQNANAHWQQPTFQRQPSMRSPSSFSQARSASRELQAGDPRQAGFSGGGRQEHVSPTARMQEDAPACGPSLAGAADSGWPHHLERGLGAAVACSQLR